MEETETKPRDIVTVTLYDGPTTTILGAALGCLMREWGELDFIGSRDFFPEPYRERARKAIGDAVKAIHEVASVLPSNRLPR